MLGSPGVPTRRAVADLGAGLALQALLEALDLAGRVDDRLLARVERVAVAADVDPQLGARRANGPLGPAGPAVHLGFVVLGMDICFHAVFAALTDAVSSVVGMTRTRFLDLLANSNLTLPAVVANRV